MKRICKILMLVAISSFFISCGMFRKAREKYLEESAAGYDKNLGTAIIKKDSTIVKYDAVKVKSRFLGKSKFIVDGDIEIPMNDVLAYQNETTFFTYTSLCGWTTRRIELAPISTYQGTYLTRETETTTRDMPTGYGTSQTMTSTSTRTRTKYQDYLQKGNGELVYYTPKNLYKLVSDYEPSKELLDEYFKTDKSLSKVGRYNTALFIAGVLMTGLPKNNAASVNSLSYVGLGLMGGTITYGFVNRKKKVRNYVKVTEALDDYNSYYKRKK